MYGCVSQIKLEFEFEKGETEEGDRVVKYLGKRKKEVTVGLMTKEGEKVQRNAAQQSQISR